MFGKVGAVVDRSRPCHFGPFSALIASAAGAAGEGVRRQTTDVLVPTVNNTNAAGNGCGSALRRRGAGPAWRRVIRSILRHMSIAGGDGGHPALWRRGAVPARARRRRGRGAGAEGGGGGPGRHPGARRGETAARQLPCSFHTARVCPCSCGGQASRRMLLPAPPQGPRGRKEKKRIRLWAWIEEAGGAGRPSKRAMPHQLPRGRMLAPRDIRRRALPSNRLVLLLTSPAPAPACPQVVEDTGEVQPAGRMGGLLGAFNVATFKTSEGGLAGACRVHARCGAAALGNRIVPRYLHGLSACPPCPPSRCWRSLFTCLCVKLTAMMRSETPRPTHEKNRCSLPQTTTMLRSGTASSRKTSGPSSRPKS